MVKPWAATEKALHLCRGDNNSGPVPYLAAACLEFHFGRRIGRELFTLPTYIIFYFINLFKILSFMNGPGRLLCQKVPGSIPAHVLSF